LRSRDLISKIMNNSDVTHLFSVEIADYILNKGYSLAVIL